MDHPAPPRKGSLELVVGPMFAGKSTALISYARALPSAGRVVLKPAFDSRYGRDWVASHDGSKVAAEVVSEWPSLPEGTTAVLVDEVQFMDGNRYRGDFTEDVRSALAGGMDVVAFGLDLDWRGTPFPVTQGLLGLARRTTWLTARCGCCGAPATMTFKKNPNGEVVELGQAELYEARCRKHWL